MTLVRLTKHAGFPQPQAIVPSTEEQERDVPRSLAVGLHVRESVVSLRGAKRSSMSSCAAVPATPRAPGVEDES